MEKILEIEKFIENESGIVFWEHNRFQLQSCIDSF